MNRTTNNRVAKLEARQRQPNATRIDAVMAALLAEYGSVDGIAACYRADGNVTSPPRVLWRAIVNGSCERAASAIVRPRVLSRPQWRSSMRSSRGVRPDSATGCSPQSVE